MYSLTDWILLGCLLLISGYGLLLLFARFFAEGHVFPYVRKMRFKLAGSFKLRMPSGRQLSLLHLESAAPQPKILLYNHGNNQDLEDLLPTLAELQANGYNVLAYDYPGYGTSTGNPSERSVLEAADTVFKYLVEQLNYRPDQIILYGFSLGSGPACYLAQRYPVAALIIEGGFTSTFRVVTRFKIVPWDVFDNRSVLPQVSCPCLLIHGKKDEIVPFWHAKSNYRTIRAAKQKLWVADAQHNDLVDIAGPLYWDSLKTFITSLPKNAGPDELERPATKSPNTFA
ncbi:MAG: alpha/beta hydrolase [Opitutales bacterium]